MIGMLKSIWLYRQFVISSIRNELVSRFSRSKFGALWMLLNPLAMVLIYSLVLSNVLAAKLPGVNDRFGYAIYLMSGLVGWTLFIEVVTRCLTLFIEQGNLLKKVNFPRITLPTIVAGSCAINNFILLSVVLVVSLALGRTFGVGILLLVPLTTLMIASGLGLGLLLGVLNVFVRDFGQIVPIILQLLFWFTPIIYPASILGEEYLRFFNFNPLYHVISAYQEIIAFNRIPELTKGLIIVSVLSVFLLLGSLYVFRRAAPELVDML